jgi:flagellin-specific chaperone FliS
MSNPFEVYRDQRVASWTRVDMVLTLYDEATNRIDRAIEALDRGDQVDSRQHCLRVLQLIACLRSGVDAEAGKLPHDILRLYNFIDHCITGGTRADLTFARKVLTPIRDSFEEIRDTVADLEQDGGIPSLHLERGNSCTI